MRGIEQQFLSLQKGELCEIMKNQGISSIFGAFTFLWTETESAIASIWWAWTWINNLWHKQYWRKWLEAIHATEALHTGNTAGCLAGEKFKKFTIFVSLEWSSQ